MGWFEELTSPETITAITGGIAAILSALGALVWKYRKSKQIDFEGASFIVKECKKIADLFKNKTKKINGKKDK